MGAAAGAGADMSKKTRVSSEFGEGVAGQRSNEGERAVANTRALRKGESARDTSRKSTARCSASANIIASREMATAQRFAQVGGHAATLLLSEDSSIVNKPSSTSELQFYTQLGPSLGVEDLIGGWTPQFYGTLTLQGKMAEDGQTVQAVPGEEVQKAAEQVSHSVGLRPIPLSSAAEWSTLTHCGRCWYWKISHIASPSPTSSTSSSALSSSTRMPVWRSRRG